MLFLDRVIGLPRVRPLRFRPEAISPFSPGKNGLDHMTWGMRRSSRPFASTHAGTSRVLPIISRVVFNIRLPTISPFFILSLCLFYTSTRTSDRESTSEMPVIWGLDLRDMQWGKFKGSYMFNQVYHLRKTKMIVYQIAMILCVVSESVGTAALSDYVDQQDGISQRSHHQAHVHNDDYVGIASYNIWVGIAVATIFGSGFFFDLFWPERHENNAVKIAWKVSSVVVSFMALADAIAMTVIVATRSAYISGVSPEYANTLFEQNGPPNRIYRHNAYCVASTVILWPGMIASFASTYIMWKSLAHNDLYGPFSSKHRSRKGVEAPIDLPISNTESVSRGNVTVPAGPYRGT